MCVVHIRSKHDCLGWPWVCCFRVGCQAPVTLRRGSNTCSINPWRLTSCKCTQHAAQLTRRVLLLFGMPCDRVYRVYLPCSSMSRFAPEGRCLWCLTMKQSDVHVQQSSTILSGAPATSPRPPRPWSVHQTHSLTQWDEECAHSEEREGFGAIPSPWIQGGGGCPYVDKSTFSPLHGGPSMLAGSSLAAPLHPPGFLSSGRRADTGRTCVVGERAAPTHEGGCLPPSADTYSGHASAGCMRPSTATTHWRDTIQVPE